MLEIPAKTPTTRVKRKGKSRGAVRAPGATKNRPSAARERPAAKNNVPEHPRAAARPAHLGFQIYRFRAIVPLLALTLALSSLIQAPIGFWPLSYFCLTPWLIVVGATSLARRVYVTSWLLGLAFYVINMYWVEATTVMGYASLSAWSALYYPLSAWPIRHAIRRRRIPLAIAVPVIWVGVEFVRSLGALGFPWFFLSHSHYAVLSMIQVSDLFGAYGLTFVIAAMNGALADVVFATVGDRVSAPRIGQAFRAKFGVGLSAALILLTLGYGRWRLSQDTVSEGPRVALLQRNYPNYTDPELVRKQPGPREKSAAYFEMMAQAEAHKPDLFLFPESAWTALYLNDEFLEADWDVVRLKYFRRAQVYSRRDRKALHEWSDKTGASIVIGSASLILTPLSLRSSEEIHNSAYHFRPGVEELERHDKVHPVLFGEIVPFRFGRLRFLYLWLNSLSPFGQGGFEYSLTPGDEYSVFTMTTRDDGVRYRFGAPICYEDVMPYVCRNFVWDRDKQEKRLDFLTNISNDGWFQHRSELEQHFAICTFRAVENRVGIARTVNTGVSGFIDPNGKAYDKVGVAETGFRVAPVMVDSRVSLYSRIGDVFALLCTLAWVVLCVDYIGVRIRSGSESEDEMDRR